MTQDSILFICVIFNAIMKRPFGNAPLKIRKLFTKEGLRKFFGKKKSSLKVSKFGRYHKKKKKKKNKKIDEIIIDVKKSTS